MSNHSHPVIRTHTDLTVYKSSEPIIVPDSNSICTAIPLVVLSSLQSQPESQPEPEPVPQLPQPTIQLHHDWDDTPVYEEPPLNIPSLITAIIVNFKTEQLTRIALTTLSFHYPFLPIILVDNGSNDASTSYIKRAGRKLHTVQSILLDNNIGHGPALHLAVQSVTTRYILAMDSDCEVLKGGFLEKMLKHFQSNSNLYAAGWLRIVDKVTGVASDRKSPGGRFIEYIHPHAMLFDREKYLKLTPFQHIGAPALSNMLSAHKLGYKLLSFPVDKYIHHLVAGTRRMYQGRWNPREDDKPSPWEKNKYVPI